MKIQNQSSATMEKENLKLRITDSLILKFGQMSSVFTAVFK